MQETVRPYDLVIVGASFAGLVAARTAAMRGLSVAVLDAKPEAGHRVATTGILVKEAADEIDIPHALTRRVHGVRLYAPNHRSIDLFAPGYFFLTTDTANVLRWLASEAMRAGAKILYRARFEGASRDGGVFRFHGLNIAARYILGADGARSAVARAFDDEVGDQGDGFGVIELHAALEAAAGHDGRHGDQKLVFLTRRQIHRPFPPDWARL